MRTIGLTLVIGWLLANSAMAGEACNMPAACTEVQTCGSADCCGRCGHCGTCEKYCKVVCEMKEVKKTVWVVKCSEFCAPLPNCGLGKSCCGCGGCESCCAAETCNAEPACSNGCNGKCDPCASEKNKCIVPPKCGKVREKKTLEKKEVVCKVPSYKCVVVYCCSNCGAQEGGAPKAAPMPPAPVKPATPPPAPKPNSADNTQLPALAGS